MLTDYIHAAMTLATYELLDSGGYYGEVEALPGVWANGPSLEECRKTLQEVVEDWLVLTLKAGEQVPILSGIDINKVGQRMS